MSTNCGKSNVIHLSCLLGGVTSMTVIICALYVLTEVCPSLNTSSTYATEK